jgi:signal transduction histidine kinase
MAGLTRDAFALEYLVEHDEAIDAELPVDVALARFRAHAHEYAAAIENNRVVGLISRSHLADLLSGRYGFALHSRAPVREQLVPDPLMMGAGAELAALLATALSRERDAFHHDVVLVGTAGELVGLVSTRRLVAAQSGLIGDQMQMLESQRIALESANAELEDSLRRQRELQRQVVAREKTALIETLVGGIAHEINNKLTPIVGFAELLRAGDEQFDEYCRMINDAARDASRIIRQLLQLSRPTATEHAVCDLRQTVEQSLTLLHLRIKEANVTLAIEGPAEPVLVSVDTTQIKQVVMNLALNALDAMEEVAHRQLTIRVLAEGGMAAIEVADTGVGITSDDMQRIFDPFFTTKAPNRGTGLGLSVSYSIVHLHGGTIAVSSVPGQGSTFRMTLPVTQIRSARREEPSLGAPAEGYQGLRVLVVEDDNAVAAMLVRVLERQLKCEVTRVGDGIAAQELLTAEDFGLIVSDVRMPRATGVDLLRWIQSERPQLRPQLLFVTGDASGSALNRELEGAGVPVLRKPLAPATLIERVRALIDGQQA